MNSTDSNPKLPTWLFIIADLALLGTAVFIASQSARPLSDRAMIGVVICVVGGAIFALVPLVLRYERQKNEALDDRQRALEALARTVAASSEQISIAANGLHEIGEITQRNLRHAEQLPHKLQEKIAEFQAQLSAAQDAEKEELERELLSLRTTESERLESVSQRIAKSSADWAKLEAATQQHLTAATEALAKLSLGTAAAIGKAQAAAEQALGQARVEAARTVGEAGGQAARAIEASKSAALADLDAKIGTAVERVTRALDQKIGRLEAATRHNETPTPLAVEPDAATALPEVAPAADTPPAKRPRKSRREEPAGSDAEPAAGADSAAPAEPMPAPPVHEPPPVPAERIAEITPVAPHTSEPFNGNISANGAKAAVEPAPDPVVAPAAELPKPTRKRAMTKKTEAPSEPALGLELDDLAASTATAVAERVLTSDGATRLLVTAYIGIGNRLFIRGEGPGLSWEKGVPLQFVSIGKWRWESNDVNVPVRFKLYKNDDLECVALGAQSLDPGHQHELTAAF